MWFDILGNKWKIEISRKQLKPVSQDTNQHIDLHKRVHYVMGCLEAFLDSVIFCYTFWTLFIGDILMEDYYYFFNNFM